jgi:photosystem II stability/assembly factor-like uncharacterized protein
MSRISIIVLASLGLLAVAACRDGGPTGVTRTPAEIRIEPSSLTLDDEESRELRAVVYDQQGTAYDALPAGLTLAWSSSAEQVAAVTPQGVVTALHPGEATITVQGGGYAATVPVTVRPVARAVELVGGDQSGTVGAPLPDSIVVRIRDRHGNGVAGTPVGFELEGGEGELSAASVPTDDAGEARVAWVLGSTAGPQRLRVTTPVPDFTELGVEATASPGAAAALVVVGGDAQSGVVGVALATPLRLRVTDAHGNPVAAVPVAWSAGAESGTLTPAAAESDADGMVEAVWTLGGRAGDQSASAEAAGEVASFGATAVAGAAAVLDKVAGDGGDAEVGSSRTLRVSVTDAHGNPVAAAAVGWEVTDGGGTLSAASSESGEDGVAEVVWTLGSQAGENRASAAAAGVAGVSFAVSGTPAALERVVAAPADATLTSLGDTLVLSAKGRDAHGNVVEVAIEWHALDADRATVSASGVVTAVAPGAARIVADAGERADTVVVTVAQRVAALAFARQPETTASGHPLAPAPEAVLHDARGNPVLGATPGVTVSLEAAPGGAELVGRLVVEAVDGVARFDSIAVTGYGEGHTLVVSVEGTSSTSDPFNSFVPPVAVADGPAPESAPGDPFHTPQGTAFVLAAPGVLANDALGSPAASLISFSVGGEEVDAGSTLTLPDGSELRVNADGGLSYTPTASFAGELTFSYTLSGDAWGTPLSSTASVSVGVGDRPAPSPADGVSWIRQRGRLTGVSFNDVWLSPTGGVAMAVGANGGALRSTDGGATWDGVPDFGSTSLGAVWGSGSTLVAVGASGAIFRSTDEGESWSPVSSGTTESLAGVWGSGGTWVAVGAAGTVLRSTDGGLTWASVASGTTNGLRAVWGNGSLVVAAGGGRTLLRSTNGGSSWTVGESPKEYRALSGSGSTLVAGGGGSYSTYSWTSGTRWYYDHYVHRSTDGGVTWSSVYSSTTTEQGWRRYMNSVTAGSGGSIVAVDDRGGLYHSADDGASWTFPPSETRVALTGVSAAGGTVVVVGAVGTIYRSQDGGATFSPVSDGYRTYNAAAGTGDALVAGGGNTYWDSRFGTSYEAYLARSVDGGVTWSTTHRSAGSLDRRVRSIHLLGPDTLLAVGHGGGAFRSANAGETWTLGGTGTTSVLHGVWGNGALALAVGEGGSIRRSLDAGVSWSESVSGTAAPLRGVRGSGSTAVAVGDAGTIVRSTDFGVSWTPVSSGTSHDLHAVWRSWDLLVAVGAGGTILRSTDGGATWEAVPSATSNLLLDVAGEGGALVATGNSGTLLRSGDLGLTWEAVESEAGWTPIHGVWVDGSGQGVAVGMHGLILRGAD